MWQVLPPSSSTPFPRCVRVVRLCWSTPSSRRIMSTTRSEDSTPRTRATNTEHEHFPISRRVTNTPCVDAPPSRDVSWALQGLKTWHQLFTIQGPVTNTLFVIIVGASPPHDLSWAPHGLKTWHQLSIIPRLVTNTLCVMCKSAPVKTYHRHYKKETECLIRICATNSRHELSMCWSTPYQDVSRKPQKLNTYHKHAPRTLDTNTSQSQDLSWTLHVWEHPLLESRDSSVMKTTACSVWSLISWFSMI